MIGFGLAGVSGAILLFGWKKPMENLEESRYIIHGPLWYTNPIPRSYISHPRSTKAHGFFVGNFHIPLGPFGGCLIIVGWDYMWRITQIGSELAG